MQIYEKKQQIQRNFMKFQENEIKYAKALTEVIDDLEFRKDSRDIDKYAPWDCTILSGSSTVLLTEIKLRNFAHDKYPTAILEQQKINHMIEIVNHYQAAFNIAGYTLVPYYLAFYTDDVPCGWVITGNEHKSGLTCPNTTAGDNTPREKVVAYFNVNEAEQFNTYL